LKLPKPAQFWKRTLILKFVQFKVFKNHKTKISWGK